MIWFGHLDRIEEQWLVPRGQWNNRLAAGRGNGMIYREGKAIRRVTEAEIVPALMEEIERFIADKAAGVNTAPPEIVPASEAEAKEAPLVTLQ
jgi:(E)-4-hydroxy-3-methylbut-2-enyl-diphosphate synthase